MKGEKIKKFLCKILFFVFLQSVFAETVVVDSFDDAQAGTPLAGRKTGDGNGIWCDRLNLATTCDGRVEVSANNQQSYILKEGAEGVCTVSVRVNLNGADLSGAYGGVCLAMTDHAASDLFVVSKQNSLSVRLVAAGPHAGKLQLRVYNRNAGGIITRLSASRLPAALENCHLFLKYDPQSLRVEGGVSNCISGEAVSVSEQISSSMAASFGFNSYGFGVVGYKSGTVLLDDFSLDCIAGTAPAAVALQELLGGKPLTVYVCAGQSNMKGARSEKSLLPPELQTVQENVFVFDGTDWRRLEPPDHGFGPEISFAYEMQNAVGGPIGIVKYSKGGTSLAKDWNPADPKSLYAQLKQKVDAARRSRKINIKGMIWMQGERDSRDEAMASAYQRNLENLIQTARRDFDSPDMVFVAGRVNPLYPLVEKVRAAQEECQEKQYSFINCDDLIKYEDHLHYTTESVAEMGRRFADKMIQLNR